MDEDFQRFIGSIESTRQQINAGLNVAMRARTRAELDNVVSAVSKQVHAQLDHIELAKDTMKRRDLLRGIGVLGLPALVPSSAAKDAFTIPVPDGPTTSLPAIRVAVERLWSARQASQYEQLAGAVPHVLSAAHRRNEQSGDAHEYLSLVYQVVAGSMRNCKALMLPGWPQSVGSCRRKHPATKQSKPVLNVAMHRPFPTWTGTLPLNKWP